MYATRTTQLIVGVFALLGIGALIYLSVSLGKIEVFEAPGYTIYANFDNISGLKVGDLVEIAGVPVGKVQSITLNGERAHVALRIKEGVKIDDEAVAAIRTRGIIGDKYVGISPGPSDHYLADGGVLRQTESAFILEDAIGQLINNAGTGSKSETAPPSGGGASPPPPSKQPSTKPGVAPKSSSISRAPGLSAAPTVKAPGAATGVR
jgi:phospholipid/cholesterol/gamma-HCH transport system substrate-binding protein